MRTMKPTGLRGSLLFSVAMIAIGGLYCATAGIAADRSAGAIPDHPDGLAYPPLRYDAPRAADYRVDLRNGIVAYLVPDRSLPLVSVHVLMRIGPDQDPDGKEGLGETAVALLTRSGTSRRTAAQLEDRVSDLGATLDSQMGGRGGGFMGMGGVPIGPSESRASLNLLSKDIDEGLALLVECLQFPAFEAERLKLHKDQLLQRMKERNDETSSIEEREWGFLMRGEGHWTNRYPTQASVASITTEDLSAFVHRYVGPKNFLLAVSGDFDRSAMAKKLERAFSGWPRPGERPGPPAAPASKATAGWFVIDKDVNQSRVSFGLTGIDRSDPEWHAALVMNDILGGGGFSSRLVNRIRSDEGLAYSVRSRQEGGVYYPDPWRVGFQTKVRSVAYAVEVALAEIARIRETPVDDQELTTTKNKFVETFPSQFETAGSIAGALAMEEMTGRYKTDPDYFVKFRERIAAVTVEDVQRVARRLLEPSRMTYIAVGNVEEMLLGDPKHEARLSGLAGGEPQRLPLRDPMTMRPMGGP